MGSLPMAPPAIQNRGHRTLQIASDDRVLSEGKAFLKPHAMVALALASRPPQTAETELDHDFTALQP
jgi:hypothetical protein